MRFISKYKRYVIGYQGEKIEHFATGESRELQPALACEFDVYGSMTAHEIEAARKGFINFGLPTEPDGMTLIDPLYRFSVFDTDIFAQAKGLTDEQQVKLEQFLLNHHDHGQDFMRVEPIRLTPPWPNYDSFRGVRGFPTAAAIAKKVHEDGYAVEDVLAYEKENANRSDVIEELDSLAAQQNPVPELEEGLVNA